MVSNVVLVVLGLVLVLAAQLVALRAAGDRRLGWSGRPPVSTGLSVTGIACVAWGQTQLQARVGGWAWLVLIPFAAAVIVPVWWHNRTVAAAASGRG
ncbi:hypothetical protein [Nakamurella deserti]|uniref:hypothetical protein n=1 Tax=Nakamurella deserti TaxID=2164074 RepID=UPI000DBE0792|nr:hypothetical protein [Nakamurella deserti]